MTIIIAKPLNFSITKHYS